MPPGTNSPINVLLVGKKDSIHRESLLQDIEGNQELRVDRVPSGEVEDIDFEGVSADCLVIYGEQFNYGGVGYVSTAREGAPHLPILLLVDDRDTKVVRDALSAEVTETIPSSLVEDDPGLLAERIIHAAGRGRSRSGYRDIFEGVSDGLLLHDPETGDIRDVNTRYCEITGYDRDELVGSNVRLIVPDDPEYTYEDALERIEKARNEGPQLFEFKGERKDGDTFLGEIHLSTIEIDGEIQVLASVRDITERRELERTYRSVFENVSDGLVVHDPETGEITDVNERFCEMNGYSRDELVGETIDVVTGPGHAYEEAQERITSAREGEPQLFEWRNEASDGSTFPVEIHLSAVDIRGEERILASVRDVTERRRREREFEQIYNGVNDIVNVYDPETKELVKVNDAMCEVTGYDREFILNNGLDAVSSVEEGYTAEWAAEVIDEVMESEEPRELDWVLETADGERRILEVNATPGTINGEDRLLAICRDVTDRRRTERRLRAILDRIDEAVFLAKAHEITQASQDPDYVSSGYEKIWGQPLQGIRDRYEDGFFGTLHPDDEADYRAFMEKIVGDIDRGTESDRYTKEYRIQTPDGETRWVQSDYYPVKWENEPPRIVIVSRNITERKERERRLVSFEDATEDLATADTPMEAAATSVEAATDTLNLSAVGVFLYDQDDGELKPEVRSQELPKDIGDQTIGPGDGSLWNAFATGSVVGGNREVAGEEKEESLIRDLADWRGIPLGNHGVLFAGSPDDTFEPETLQSALILGATLEAALNHLKGQQRLQTREEELRTETARAERLDRITRLTQQVEAAIVQASDSSDVERAVCDRLVDTGPYSVAWIGGVEVGTDRITPRTVVGESDRYVDSMDLTTTTDAADPHPAVRAWQTESVELEDSIVGEGPSGEWRQHVLSRGYQSVCAVPLTYDGITHGLLCIAADSPNAFGERTRSVLEQLGASIGHALAGIERRRALESDETIELEFQGTGTSLQFAELADEAGCRVRHERTVRREDGGVSVYYALESDPPEDIVEEAEQTLSGSVEVVRDEGETLLIEVLADTWFGSPLAEYGAVLRRAEAIPDNTTLTVELPARSDVRSFTERLEELTPTLELEAKRQHQRTERTPQELRNRIEERLTDRQREALRTAFMEGYFKWPRESDGGEVADRLDITQPTFNKHLRLAEQKTLDALFGNEE